MTTFILQLSIRAFGSLNGCDGLHNAPPFLSVSGCCNGLSCGRFLSSSSALPIDVGNHESQSVSVPHFLVTSFAERALTKATTLPRIISLCLPLLLLPLIFCCGGKVFLIISSDAVSNADTLSFSYGIQQASSYLFAYFYTSSFAL